MAKTDPKAETREARLAKALRANLRRRKAQERAREDDAATEPSADEGAEKDT